MAALFSSLIRSAKSSSSSLSPDPEGERCCRRISRGKLICILAISLLTVIIFLLQCFNLSVFPSSLCCSGSKQGLYGDYYEDYDETMEGSRKIRYRHTKRYLPQALIIGVRKGGTRALLEFLNLHPNVQAAKKEMHFFDIDETYSRGVDWYRKKMPYAFKDQITMEKTPAYFTTETVPERVYNMNRSVLLIVVVRDPIRRTISDYTQIHSNKLEKGRIHQPFEDLVLDENGEIRRSYAAVRRSIYHRHMERWLQFFPLKQFHFVSSEILVTNPVHELRMVEDFLGLEHKLNDDFFYFNQTKGFYCIKKPFWTKQKEKCLAKSKGRMHPDVDDSVVDKMKEFFTPHNEKFFDMIDNHRFNWSS